MHTIHYIRHILTTELAGYDIRCKFTCLDEWQALRDAQLLNDCAKYGVTRTHLGEGRQYQYHIVPGSVRVSEA